MFDLSGRVALVTGGGRSVGAGIARALAGQGASVVVNDLLAERAEEVASELASSGAASLAMPFDVTDERAVQDGFAEAASKLGPIDVLVNNAGVPEGMGVKQFRETDASEYAQYIDLNLYGVIHCSRAVLDGMCERGWGRIVTISSGAGQIGIPLGVSIYGAGKGGAIAFMRHIAMEVARTGVTANSLALGMMNNVGNEEATKALGAQVPVGRLGTPEDIGAAVAFLASNESAWITGQTIGVNGGSVTS